MCIGVLFITFFCNIIVLEVLNLQYFSGCLCYVCAATVIKFIADSV